MKALNTQSLILMTLTAALLSACGSSGITGTGTTVGTDLPQYDIGEDNALSFGGAYPMGFTTVGKDKNGGISTPYVSAPLSTDNKLVIQATLAAATQNQNTPVYTNYTANYGCATLRISLLIEQNGTYVQLASVDTNRLAAANTPGCAGSVTSQIIDWSSYMYAGHGNVKITVAAITSNVNCVQSVLYPYNYPWNYAAVCANNPMQSIYQYHVVNGNLQVQVNGTDFVK